MRRDKKLPGFLHRIRSQDPWRHAVAVGILLWLAWIYWNYFPRFYAHLWP